jgi:VWFA-related protein
MLCSRKACLRLALVLLFALVSTLPVLAQGNVTLKVDRLESGPNGQMTAYVTVRDENGVPIPGLQSANFTVVEDQRTSFPPEQLSTQANPEARLTTALVMDLSGTMQGQALDEAKKASAKYLETLLDQPNDPDRVAFFGINGPVNISDLAISEKNREIDFTNDRNRILNLINSLEVTGNSPTPLYDALFRAIKITALQQAPRAIIVITDGQDKVSKLSADDPISEANRNNIPIFPIGFSRGQVNDEYLTRLAARTGGTYTPARDAGQFTQVFGQTLDQLSQQYVLTYPSRLARDAQPHAVLVRVDNPKGKAYDDQVFFFKDVPTSAPIPGPTVKPASASASATQPAVVMAGQPEATAEPPAPAPPSAPQGLVDQARGFLNQRSNLPILFGVLAGLLLILALILLLISRRHKHDDAGSPAPEAYAYEPPTVGGAPAGATGVTGAGTAANVYSSTAAGTEGGAGVSPWAVPGGQASPYASPPPMAGDHTVILNRNVQPQVVAILINPKQTQQRFDLGASTDVGRGPNNQIVLSDVTVSRQHAKIKAEGDQFLLYDLGSANGTTVNGAKVTEPVILNDGDIVRFGEVEFRFKRLT